MKTKAQFLFFSCSLVFHLAGQIPQNGLIGGWPLDGSAADMSNSGNHGTISGATPTLDRFGNPGHAYHFDGINDFIVMLAAGPTGSVSRSVSFWSKSINTAIQVPFGYGEASSPGGIYQVVYNYNCTGVGFDNSQAAYIRGNQQVADGQWHHIAVVYDAGMGNQIGNIKIYVDTLLQTVLLCNVGFGTSNIQSNGQYPITIGRSSNSMQRFFEGDLDDFYEYNRPLQHSEIVALFLDLPCKVKPGMPAQIVGSSTLCLGSAHVYSVAPVPNATYYTWYLPGGWQGSSLSNTIHVTAQIAGGNISVAAFNSCGTNGYITRYINASHCSGVEENSFYDPVFFPNPAGDVMMFRNLPNNCELVVTDLSGRVVMRVFPGPGDDRFNCHQLTAGVYLVNVMSDGRVIFTHKMLRS